MRHKHTFSKDIQTNTRFLQVCEGHTGVAVLEVGLGLQATGSALGLALGRPEISAGFLVWVGATLTTTLRYCQPKRRIHQPAYLSCVHRFKSLT